MWPCFWLKSIWKVVFLVPSRSIREITIESCRVSFGKSRLSIYCRLLAQPFQEVKNYELICEEVELQAYGMVTAYCLCAISVWHAKLKNKRIIGESSAWHPQQSQRLIVHYTWLQLAIQMKTDFVTIFAKNVLPAPTKFLQIMYSNHGSFWDYRTGIHYHPNC